jgi:putative transposase
MEIISNIKNKGDVEMARLNEREMELVGILCGECSTPADLTMKLKELFAGALEKMLEAELEEHLGYEKHNAAGNNSGNSRNGFNKKTIKSEWGESEIPSDAAEIHKD